METVYSDLDKSIYVTSIFHHDLTHDYCNITCTIIMKCLRWLAWRCALLTWRRHLLCNKMGKDDFLAGNYSSLWLYLPEYQKFQTKVHASLCAIVPDQSLQLLCAQSYKFNYVQMLVNRNCSLFDRLIWGISGMRCRQHCLSLASYFGYCVAAERRCN